MCKASAPSDASPSCPTSIHPFTPQGLNQHFVLGKALGNKDFVDGAKFDTPLEHINPLFAFPDYNRLVVLQLTPRRPFISGPILKVHNPSWASCVACIPHAQEGLVLPTASCCTTLSYTRNAIVRNSSGTYVGSTFYMQEMDPPPLFKV